MLPCGVARGRKATALGKPKGCPERQTAIDGDFAVAIGYRAIPDSNGNDDTARTVTVGTRIRGNVNGQLVLEAVDNQAFVGSTGLVTYHAQADFDTFRALTP